MQLKTSDDDTSGAKNNASGDQSTKRTNSRWICGRSNENGPNPIRKSLYG